MPRYDFDMITIGAGSGGVASSRRAGSYGARVAIVEESRIGGTCVLRGCVPKKLLVYGAQFADAFADAAGFGWTRARRRASTGPRLIAAKNNELDRLEQIYVNMLKNSGVEIIEGRGVLVDPHTVEVAGRRYTAENILIATGGAPDRAGHPRHRARDLVERGARPAANCRAGSSSSAAAISRSSSPASSAASAREVVEMIRREELLYGFDDDIRVALAQEMRGRGIEIHTRTQVARIEKDPREGYTVFTDDRPGNLGRSRHVRDRPRPQHEGARARRGRGRRPTTTARCRSTNGRRPAFRTSTRSAT